jgi:hypothetical protein
MGGQQPATSRRHGARRSTAPPLRREPNWFAPTPRLTRAVRRGRHLPRAARREAASRRRPGRTDRATDQDQPTASRRTSGNRPVSRYLPGAPAAPHDRPSTGRGRARYPPPPSPYARAAGGANAPPSRPAAPGRRCPHAVLRAPIRRPCHASGCRSYTSGTRRPGRYALCGGAPSIGSTSNKHSACRGPPVSDSKSKTPPEACLLTCDYPRRIGRGRIRHHEPGPRVPRQHHVPEVIPKSRGYPPPGRPATRRYRFARARFHPCHDPDRPGTSSTTCSARPPGRRAAFRASGLAFPLQGRG